MDQDQIKFILNTDQSLIAREVPSQRILEISIQAPKAVAQNHRPALNLALILDRSGSMSGEKLAYVKRAAQHVLDLLEEQDRIALVAYDDEINLISPSVQVTHHVRKTLKSRIAEIDAGASTNLSGGWLAGCQEVAASTKGDILNRALLLTDGLANVGIVDLEELAQHAKELSRRGISTTTFGVGEGFNEHLLEAMANQGGGNFYYIATPHLIPELFQREFKELAAVTASEVELIVEMPPHVHAQVPGGWRVELSEGQMRIFVGSLYSTQQADLFIKLLTPPAESQDQLLFKVTLIAKNESSEPVELKSEVTFAYTSLQAAEAAPKSRQLMERFAAVDLAESTTEALKLERLGKNKQAGQVMAQAIAANAPFLPMAQVEEYGDMTERMKHGMAEADRKQSHYQAYNQKRGKIK